MRFILWPRGMALVSSLPHWKRIIKPLISINEANLQLPDGKTLSALLFAGSFNYGIEGATSQERLDRLQKAINNWQIDLETFQEIVSQRFLPQQIHESVFFQS
jgi:hypothetical protein